MTEKIKTYLTKLAQRITKTKRGSAKDSMRIICFYGAGLAGITILYIAGWLWQWYHTEAPDLPALADFFKEFTAPTVVAAITFVSVWHVDKNRDGRPDIAELRAKGETKGETK